MHGAVSFGWLRPISDQRPKKAGAFLHGCTVSPAYRCGSRAGLARDPKRHSPSMVPSSPNEQRETFELPCLFPFTKSAKTIEAYKQGSTSDKNQKHYEKNVLSLKKGGKLRTKRPTWSKSPVRNLPSSTLSQWSLTRCPSFLGELKE